MKTVIATFGEAPGGIVAVIKQNGCEKLILLMSKDPSKKAERGLEDIESLTKQLDIKLKKIEVPPYSLMENIHRIKEIINSEKENEIILNVTGGRKPLSLAATLAGFVSNPKRIIYVTEENDEILEIPKLTIGEKMLSQEKRTILNSIKTNTKTEEITDYLKGKNSKSNEYHNVMKHLRELADMGLIKINDGRPYTYSITPSGELLR
ncbi:MAG: DUF6293 family protein [Candidatus Firestonebacteria bacterium]